MIKDIKIQFGSHPEGENLFIETSPVNVFVGPNNSGKSKLLTEIKQFSESGTKNHTFKLIDDISFNELDEHQRVEEIARHTLTPNANERVNQGNVLFSDGRTRNQIQVQKPNQIFTNPNVQKNEFCAYYLSYKTLKLGSKGNYSKYKLRFQTSI
jgi:predicted ATPase